MTVNNREIGTILTTEQLKKMDGMPVWSDDLGVFGIVNVDAVGMFKDIPFLVGPNFNYDIEKRGLRLYEATCFGHPLERVRELVQADRERRVHILPSPRANTCGKCGNFTRTPGCGYGECTLRPGLRPYQSRAKCKRYTEKALEEMEGNENG